MDYVKGKSLRIFTNIFSDYKYNTFIVEILDTPYMHKEENYYNL